MRTSEVRNSQSHRLEINWLEPPHAAVGLTFAPGKNCWSNSGFRWSRDLGADLDTIRSEGATVLVCLMEDRELEQVGLSQLAECAAARDIELVRFPIRDVRVPKDRASVDELLALLDARIAAGKRVVIHCLGGRGRTGTIAGCYLVRHGVAPEEALAMLRRVRSPDCPETDDQRDYVRDHARRRENGWYALDPQQLTDQGVRARLLEQLRVRDDRAARRVVEALENSVAAAPSKAFERDERSVATLVADRRYAAGVFTTPTLAELRAKIDAPTTPGKFRLSVLSGASPLNDIGSLQATAPPDALFQVASQFNCLEAPSERIVRVRDYLHDPTQGPRASISALPGILLRHYFAPSDDGGRFVQSDSNCLNLLRDVTSAQTASVTSGYLLSRRIVDRPAFAAALVRDFDRIRVGVHDGIEVTLGHDWSGPVHTTNRIAQVLTSTIALGGYSHDDGSEALATIRRQLLRAAYLGTLLAALALKKEVVVLTMIGGGAFANPRKDIWEAIFWALDEAHALASGVIEVIVNTREAVGDREREIVAARSGRITRL